MGIMQEIYDEMAKHNLIDDDSFLQRSLDFYKESSRPMTILSGETYHDRNSDFYDFLTRTDSKSVDTSEVNDEDYKKFYINMTNNWISNVLSLSDSQLNELAKYGLDGYTKIKEILNEYRHVDSMDEIAELYNKISTELGDGFIIEKEKYFWRSLQSKVGFNADNDYISDFTHVNSRYGKARQEKLDGAVEYRLYINCTNADLFKLANAYVDYCNQKGMHYYFKYQTSSNRHDKFLIYSSKEQLKNNLTILKQIAKDYPDIVAHCGPTGEIVGNIDDWIGLASEPENKYFKYRQSFNTLRAEILEDAAEQIMLSYIRKNKSKPEIRKEIIDKATEVVLEDMKRRNPQAKFTQNFVNSLKSYLASSNPSLHGAVPILSGFRRLNEVMPKKNELFGSNFDPIFILKDPEGKEYNYSIVTADKVLKSLTDVMEKDNPNYLEDYRAEIKRRCKIYRVDPNNFALNISSLEEFKNLDKLDNKRVDIEMPKEPENFDNLSIEEKVNYYKEMSNYYKENNDIEGSYYYEANIDYLLRSTMNDKEIIQYLEKRKDEYSNIGDNERANYYQEQINRLNDFIQNQKYISQDNQSMVAQNSQIQQQLANAFKTVELQKKLETEDNIGKSSAEIDVDIDDFAKQERQILSSKHFTEKQKKMLIEELYNDFDNYVEENPEIHRTR